MKVILKQDVEKLGKAGEIVKVAPGYGRNYLIPRKIALEATPGNLKISEIERTVGARRDQRDKQAGRADQVPGRIPRAHPAAPRSDRAYQGRRRTGTRGLAQPQSRI